MSLVVFLVVLFGISRTTTGVYLQYWLDAGDGLMVGDTTDIFLFVCLFVISVGSVNDSDTDVCEV